MTQRNRSMNQEAPAAMAIPRLCRALARCALALVLALPAAQALAAKDTIFGIELIPAHFPNSSSQDFVDTLSLTAQAGGHSSLIWHWSDTQTRDQIPAIVAGMRQFGLKSLVQVGAIFLNAPGPPEGYVKSFGDTWTRVRFLNDVTMIANTQPDYVVLATEINLLYRFNPAEFAHYRTLYAQAYATIKAISPGTKVGVSFLYSLWFANYFLDNIDVPAMLGTMDFIAFTTYPEWLLREGHFARIQDIPPDFHGAVRIAYPNARVVFSEVGWASKVRGTPEEQALFVRELPRLLSTARPELVTWAVLHDMEFFNRSLLDAASTQFLESIGVDIDALFGHFNAMGLRDGFGNPKPSWSDALQLQFTVP